MSSRILITGVAGFIGFHVCKRLLEEDTTVVGIDNLNDYYDVDLKKARLRELEETIIKYRKGKFSFFKCDLEDKNYLTEIFHKF